MQAREYIKGRGAQIHSTNKFEKNQFIKAHWEGIDEDIIPDKKTTYLEVFPKSIVNLVESADIPIAYSVNPYQGCEHGCIYCYARESHQYWGYNSGLAFEQNVLVKKNAVELLEKKFQNQNWKVDPISLSGNTDCYQPIERQYKLTRALLELCLKYQHPVQIITKNSLIERDLDILKQLNDKNLVQVFMSVSTLNESLRRVLEPRTSTAERKLKTIRLLSENQIPVAVLMAPVIPGLNSHEIFEIAKKTSEAGAVAFNYSLVRLNGSIGTVFTDWVKQVFPDRADKVIKGIKECHNGSLEDKRIGIRMRGQGQYAEMLERSHKLAKETYFKNRKINVLNRDAFIRNKMGQLNLF